MALERTVEFREEVLAMEEGGLLFSREGAVPV